MKNAYYIQWHRKLNFMINIINSILKCECTSFSLINEKRRKIIEELCHILSLLGEVHLTLPILAMCACVYEKSTTCKVLRYIYNCNCYDCYSSLIRHRHFLLETLTQLLKFVLCDALIMIRIGAS